MGIRLLAALLASLSAEAGEISALVNGKSLHIGAREEWNENNYGLGVEYAFASESRWKWTVMANGFVDSVDNISYMAGGGLHRRIWQTERVQGLHIDLGLNAFLMTRRDVNRGRPFPGAVPSISVGNRHIGANLSYLPRIAVELMYQSDDVDRGITGILFLQLRLNASLLGLTK